MAHQWYKKKNPFFVLTILQLDCESGAQNVEKSKSNVCWLWKVRIDKETKNKKTKFKSVKGYFVRRKWNSSCWICLGQKGLRFSSGTVIKAITCSTTNCSGISESSVHTACFQVRLWSRKTRLLCWERSLRVLFWLVSVIELKKKY